MRRSPAPVLSPFGGMKQSSNGREGILEYCESKYVSLALPDDIPALPVR